MPLSVLILTIRWWLVAGASECAVSVVVAELSPVNGNGSNERHVSNEVVVEGGNNVALVAEASRSGDGNPEIVGSDSAVSEDLSSGSAVSENSESPGKGGRDSALTNSFQETWCSLTEDLTFPSQLDQIKQV